MFVTSRSQEDVQWLETELTRVLKTMKSVGDLITVDCFADTERLIEKSCPAVPGKIRKMNV